MNEQDNKLTDDHLIDLARESFADVEPEVAARLAAMRREAVQIADASPGASLWLERLLAPAGLAAAGAALALVLAVWLALRPTDDAAVLPLLSEPEIAMVQDLDLLEDLEFLAWLEEEPDGAG